MQMVQEKDQMTGLAFVTPSLMVPFVINVKLDTMGTFAIIVKMGIITQKMFVKVNMVRNKRDFCFHQFEGPEIWFEFEG